MPKRPVAAPPSRDQREEAARCEMMLLLREHPGPCGKRLLAEKGSTSWVETLAIARQRVAEKSHGATPDVSMPTIVVSELCYRHIAANVQGTFRSAGVKLQDGSWSLPVDDEVLVAISAAARQGETTSDTILRLFFAEVPAEGQGRVGTRYH